MIRVLSDDNNFHSVERTEVESIKNELFRRITGMILILLTHQSGEIHKVRLLKLGTQMLPPRFFYLYVHTDS